MEYPLGIVEYCYYRVNQWNTGPVFYQSGKYSSTVYSSTMMVEELSQAPACSIAPYD